MSKKQTVWEDRARSAAVLLLVWLAIGAAQTFFGLPRWSIDLAFMALVLVVFIYTGGNTDGTWKAPRHFAMDVSYACIVVTFWNDFISGTASFELFVIFLLALVLVRLNRLVEMYEKDYNPDEAYLQPAEADRVKPEGP